MIHMMLYEEEVSGALWPERIYTRWPARCHVTRRRAQRDCPSTTPLPTESKLVFAHGPLNRWMGLRDKIVTK